MHGIWKAQKDPNKQTASIHNSSSVRSSYQFFKYLDVVKTGKLIKFTYQYLLAISPFIPLKKVTGASLPIFFSKFITYIRFGKVKEAYKIYHQNK